MTTTMISRTNEEIKQKIKELWPDQKNSWDEIDVDITREGDKKDKNAIFIKLSKMYEAPGLSFKQIQALAKFFNTLNVETESEFHNGGCETCDYGSEVGFYLRISPGDEYKEFE